MRSLRAKLYCQVSFGGRSPFGRRECFSHCFVAKNTRSQLCERTFCQIKGCVELAKLTRRRKTKKKEQRAIVMINSRPAQRIRPDLIICGFVCRHTYIVRKPRSIGMRSILVEIGQSACLLYHTAAAQPQLRNGVM